MDGAEASHPYPAVGPRGMARRVGGRSGGCAASGVSLGEAATGADLGGSSKYSNESFEDWSGEGFHVNSSWTWVSRS